MVTVRKAGPSDMPHLLAFLLAFAKESDWKLEADLVKAIDKANLYICDPESDVLIAFYEESPLGVAVVSYDDGFFNARFGYLLEFYVSKNGRGTGLARQLM